MNPEAKPWYQSNGVLAGLATVAFSLAGLAGWQVAPQEQAAAIAHGVSIVTAVTGLWAIFGRINASKKIG